MKPAATDTDLHPVMILAGGTGGHIFPGLAVARALRERGQPVMWLGAEGGMETRLVPQHDIAIDTIAVRGVRGKGLTTLLFAPFKLLGTVRAAAQVLRQRQPRGALNTVRVPRWARSKAPATRFTACIAVFHSAQVVGIAMPARSSRSTR
mgnify:CR=1 FL=1